VLMDLRPSGSTNKKAVLQEAAFLLVEYLCDSVLGWELGESVQLALNELLLIEIGYPQPGSGCCT
jgi:hypothetical protein